MGLLIAHRPPPMGPHGCVVLLREGVTALSDYCTRNEIPSPMLNREQTDMDHLWVTAAVRFSNDQFKYAGVVRSTRGRSQLVGYKRACFVLGPVKAEHDEYPSAQLD
ncbi:hypothetical protein FRC20_004223 [Serendipita sp. 405]|nr:hypothetical protein FRC15_010971 [Serendipita sp. 397]KAG8842857.1 hypothetical protein FRC20_004223 [Serendipita sp. 405]